MKIPSIPPTGILSLDKWLRDFSLLVDKELRSRIPNAEAASSFLLVSPAGKVYSVAVDDAGALVTTLVRDI